MCPGRLWSSMFLRGTRRVFDVITIPQRAELLKLYMDTRATSLIETRLKYNWTAWFVGILMLLVHFLFDGETERIVFFGLSLIMIEIAGPSSYRKALRGEEGYHFLCRQTIDCNSSFGLILVCIFFEVFVLMMMLLYLISGLNGFTLA